MIYRSIIASGIKIESLNPSIAKEAGILKSDYKQVPLVDCIIASTKLLKIRPKLFQTIHISTS